MILTDSMIEAALNFRDAEPWEELTDSDIFAVQLANGQKAYCAIMGNAGQHFSLGIYVGEKGFTTYLSNLSMPDDQLSIMQRVVQFDCINCDFMQANEIDPTVKKIIRSYATMHDRKIPRKHGWIDFTRFSPYKAQWCITRQEDARIAEECLKAATFFAEYFHCKSYEEVGLDSWGRYPSIQGGKSIPLLLPQGNNTYKLGTTKTPGAIIEPPASPSFNNDILAHRIMSLPKTQDLECRLLHAPSGVMVDGEEVPVLAGSILLVDKNTGMLLMPFTTTDYPSHTTELLTKFANHLADYQLNPSQIDVCDENTYQLLQSFCEKCAIKLNFTEHPVHLNEVCSYFLAQMMGL